MSTYIRSIPREELEALLEENEDDVEDENEQNETKQEKGDSGGSFLQRLALEPLPFNESGSVIGSISPARFLRTASSIPSSPVADTVPRLSRSPSNVPQQQHVKGKMSRSPSTFTQSTLGRVMSGMHRGARLRSVSSLSPRNSKFYYRGGSQSISDDRSKAASPGRKRGRLSMLAMPKHKTTKVNKMSASKKSANLNSVIKRLRKKVKEHLATIKKQGSILDKFKAKAAAKERAAEERTDALVSRIQELENQREMDKSSLLSAGISRFNNAETRDDSGVKKQDNLQKLAGSRAARQVLNGHLQEALKEKEVLEKRVLEAEKELKEKDGNQQLLKDSIKKLRGILERMMRTEEWTKNKTKREREFWKSIATDELLLDTEVPDSLPLPESARRERRWNGDLFARLKRQAKLSETEIKHLKTQIEAEKLKNKKTHLARGLKVKALRAELAKKESSLVGAVRRIHWLVEQKKELDDKLKDREKYIVKLETKLLQAAGGGSRFRKAIETTIKKAKNDAKPTLPHQIRVIVAPEPKVRKGPNSQIRYESADGGGPRRLVGSYAEEASRRSDVQKQQEEIRKRQKRARDLKQARANLWTSIQGSITSDDDGIFELSRQDKRESRDESSEHGFLSPPRRNNGGQSQKYEGKHLDSGRLDEIHDKMTEMEMLTDMLRKKAMEAANESNSPRIRQRQAYGPDTPTPAVSRRASPPTSRGASRSRREMSMQHASESEDEIGSMSVCSEPANVDRHTRLVVGGTSVPGTPASSPRDKISKRKKVRKSARGTFANSFHSARKRVDEIIGVSSVQSGLY